MAAALATGSKDDVTGALEDLSTDAYTEGIGDDTATVPAGILATCAVIAGHLLDTLADPTTNADDLADSVTQDQASFCTVAGQLDTDQPHTVNADDDPCDVCDGHDGDDASDGNARPWHPGCGCTIQPTTENRSRRRTTKMTTRTPTNGRESRQYAREFRADDLVVKGNTATLHGRPIVYNTAYDVSDMAGTFSETMAPGVAAHLLGTADVRFLFNHQGMALARSKGPTPTLTFHDTPTALEITAQLDTRQGLANDLVIGIERGDCDQMSVGFCVERDQWSGRDAYGLENVRLITRFSEFLDVSAVTYPASPTTSIDVVQRMMTQGVTAREVRWAERTLEEYRKGKKISAENMGHVHAILAHAAHLAGANGNWSPTAASAGDDGTLNAPFPGGAGPSANYGNGDGSGSRSRVTIADLDADLVEMKTGVRPVRSDGAVTIDNLNNDLARLGR